MLSKKFIEKERVRETILSTITEGLIVCNANGIIVYSNEPVLELFGYERDEILNQPIEVLIPKNIAEKHKGMHQSYFNKPAKRKMGEGRELHAVKNNGEHFPVEVSLNYFTQDNEIYALALVTDISKRKASENEVAILKKTLESQVKKRTKELEESRMIYEIISRNYPNGTINVFDENFNYVFVEGRELYSRGVTSKDLIGTNYFDLLPKAIIGKLKAKLESIQPGEEINFELQSGENTYQINALLIDFKDKKQLLLVEQNISDQKNAQKKVEEALKVQTELNELKSRFVSMASHEFRTPLSTILSSADLASKYSDLSNKEKEKKHLSRIKSSVKNLSSILNDFLSLSKLEEGKVNTEVTAFSLKEFLKELCEELEDTVKENQVIEFRLESDLEMVTDRNILKNILINLISNASKYSSDGQVIKIVAQAIGNNLEIRVEDKGMGMSSEDLDNLFERFFRASNVMNIQGTGLGLHIVKRYLEMINGSIWVESELNKGSVFSIKIPMTN